MYRIALLSLSLRLAIVAFAADEDLCLGSTCDVEVQSQSLLQRKHVSAAPAQVHEEKAKAKNNMDGPACEGVESDGRCWYLSEVGESCEAACLKHGRSFKFKMPTPGKPIMPMLLNKEPQKQEGPWRAFECYKPEEDHLNLVSKCSANDYRDNQGSWSDASCQLACPCGGVKECGWRQPEACVPVFQYKDEQMTGCPKADSDRPWCSHDHDKADEWSNCVYTCTDASENGAIEMFAEPPFPEKAEADEIEMMSTHNPDSVELSSSSIVAIAAQGADCLEHKREKREKAVVETLAAPNSKQIASKDSPVTVGLDSEGDSLEKKDEPIASESKMASAGALAKIDDSTQTITEDTGIETLGLKDGDSLSKAGADTFTDAQKKVEQHDHRSDPEEVSEETSTATEEVSETPTNASNATEEVGGNASDAIVNFTNESSMESSSFQPSLHFLSLLALPLIAGTGM